MPVKPYVNDQWTLALEELGFHHHAHELAQMILLCEPPFAVCMAGRWGTGKTSVMRYAMTLLGGQMPQIRLPYQTGDISDKAFRGRDRVAVIRDRGKALCTAANFVSLSQLRENDLAKPLDRVATLWFSPWRFQNEPNPMVPLLHGLREQLDAWARARGWLDKHARALVDSGLEMLAHLADAAGALAGIKAGVTAAAGVFKRALHKIEADRFETATDAERFNLLFEHAIRSILGVDTRDSRKARNARDARDARPDDDAAGSGDHAENDDDSDSDGSEPGDPRHRLVIFVDDLDRCEGPATVRLLEAVKLYLSSRHCVFVLGLDVPAVESALAGEWKERPHGFAREYLDKLFQSYVHMPVSTRYPLLVHNQLHAWDMLPAGAQRIDWADPAWAGKAHLSARLVADIVPPNPRKVKNFLNSVRLAWDVAQRRTGGGLTAADLDKFAAVQRLRGSFPRTFTALVQDPEHHLPLLETFLNNCVTRRAIPTDPGNAVMLGILVKEFRHVAALESGWTAEPLNPALRLADVDVYLESVAADRKFAERWADLQIDAAQFRQYAGLTGPAVEASAATAPAAALPAAAPAPRSTATISEPGDPARLDAPDTADTASGGSRGGDGA